MPGVSDCNELVLRPLILRQYLKDHETFNLRSCFGMPINWDVANVGAVGC